MICFLIGCALLIWSLALAGEGFYLRAVLFAGIASAFLHNMIF